jgi:hypothetical protein
MACEAQTGFLRRYTAACPAGMSLEKMTKGLMEGTRWIYDSANDEALLAITRELTQAEGKYGQRALDYMRTKKVFSPDLSVPAAAFAKSIELMQKAGLADDQLAKNADRVLDDTYRTAALRDAGHG